jgi:hypothetical protein
MIKLRYINLILIIISITCLESYCCDDKELDSIKNKVRTIDSLVTELQLLLKLSENGDSLTAYYYEGSLKKIFVKDNKKAVTKSFEIYFNNGKLIYIYESLKKFLPSELKKESNYYYFKDNKMICWQKKDLLIAEKDEIFSNTESELLSKIEKYLTEIQ